jgi:hypothetical protein
MNKLRLWVGQIRHMWSLMTWNQRLGLSFQGVIAGATILYVVVALLQRSTMNQQLKTMQAQMSLQERPWISEEITVVKKLTFLEGARHEFNVGSMVVNILLKNTGHSVAINVNPLCKIIARPTGPIGANVDTLVAESEQRVCGNLGAQSDINPQVGYVMFPGATITDTSIVGISKLAVVTASRNNLRKDHMIATLLVCCVDYRFAYENTHHQTRRNYALGTSVPGFPGLSYSEIIPVGTIDNLVLIPSFDGNLAN